MYLSVQFIDSLQTDVQEQSLGCISEFSLHHTWDCHVNLHYVFNQHIDNFLSICREFSFQYAHVDSVTASLVLLVKERFFLYKECD